MVPAIVSTFCAVLVAAVCVILVLHKDYEDGLVGRISLSFIGVAGVARAMQLIASEFDRAVSPIGVLLWIGLAIFFARHLYRFLRWRRSGDGDWRKVRQVDTGGKHPRPIGG